jgi:glycosyltransferase involved in cell wall biosynthesis
MKKLLIASFDMEVGGVERSLISMLESFDYNTFNVDLMLYRHHGDFMNLISKKVSILKEVPQYSTFRKSISDVFKDGQYFLGISRIISKIKAEMVGKIKRNSEPGYYQMQLMWKNSLPFLPELNNEYEVAISYLWPHYFVAEKVNAKKKIAWIHTDFSKLYTNINMDLKMWKKFDYIIAVSDACKASFVTKYKELEDKVIVIENITAPEFVRAMSKEKISNPLKEESQFKILTVARLTHAKGIDNAIAALRILRDKGLKDIIWYIVGYGGEEAYIKELIMQNKLENNFILLGKKINPYPYINKCDLYVQPSRYEGKAVTVTEAKILGKPILINNYTTAKSQIEHEVDGLICESLCPESLADGIERLYQNKELRAFLINNIKGKDFSNYEELNKLYKLIG